MADPGRLAGGGGGGGGAAGAPADVERGGRTPTATPPPGLRRAPRRGTRHALERPADDEDRGETAVEQPRPTSGAPGAET